MSPNLSDRDRGNALYLQGRHAEAAECYRRALRQKPDDVDALNNLGAALADLGQLTDAIKCYQAALRVHPRHAEAHYNLGNALRLAGRFDEALECYVQALRLRPDMAEAHNNLGIVLRKRGRLAESMASARRALELRPDGVTALVNLGLGLAETGRHAEALGCYDEVIRRTPDDADAHHNRAQTWILLGDWERGWPEYEWRWRCAEFTPPPFSQPRWDGGPLDGRTILLHAEQGAGDTLQFVRYAPLVKQRGATVLLAAPERLHPILRTADGIDRLLPPPRTAALPPFDVHCPLLSLPACCGTTTSNVPACVPYLRAEPERVAHWRDRLAPVAGFRVGVAWQGSPTMLPYDLWRSIPLERFAPLAQVPGVRLVSLQRGAGSEQVAALDGKFPIVDVNDELDESSGAFLDTAAVMANLDLVVACDTAIAHLAGALGVPAWVALPIAPNSRWMLDREDTPWYPSLRLFRQVRAGSWEEPLARMAKALSSLVDAKAGASGEGEAESEAGPGGRGGVKGAPVRRPQDRGALDSAPATPLLAVPMTPGELLDRRTILAIKADRFTDAQKLRNVHAELASTARDAERLFGSCPELAGLHAELRGVNEALWDVEDAIRRYEAQGDFGPGFIELARAVYRNNDRRAALKRQINELLGCIRQEEKQYATG